MSWLKSVLKRSEQSAPFSLYKYRGLDEYTQIQTAGNKRKIELSWADEPTIHKIADLLKEKVKPIRRGLCHGVRRGNEQRWFSERLGKEVLGTDISDTATQFPNTVQWDFHESRPEWIGAFDFVYTNSHDHAYDPKKAMDAWVGQLADHGVLVIEHSAQHADGNSTKLDPFRVQAEYLPYLVLEWGAGRYAVRDLHKLTKESGMEAWVYFISKT